MPITPCPELDVCAALVAMQAEWIRRATGRSLQKMQNEAVRYEYNPMSTSELRQAIWDLQRRCPNVPPIIFAHNPGNSCYVNRPPSCGSFRRGGC